jgi:predicted MFS family arabinose efflux permease
MTTKLTPKSTLRQIPLSIWILGLVSMLMDISSEMIHSLLPLFMVTTLGTSVFAVGLIEGLAESTALIVKVFSGALSDYLGKRKVLALFGYGLGALTKPLFAIASSTGIVLTARLLDRVGKGVRGAPRDALVADIAPQHLRGAAFGLRQSLDTVGAFLGPLLAVALMLLWANDFRAVFWVAVIPGMMALALLFFGVREPQRQQDGKRTNPIRRENLRRLGACHKQSLGTGTDWRRNLGAAHGHNTGIAGNDDRRYRSCRSARHSLWILQPSQRHCHAAGKHYRRTFVGSTWSISYVLRRGGFLCGCTFCVG